MSVRARNSSPAYFAGSPIKGSSLGPSAPQIPTSVDIRAIPVPFPIRLVMLLVVRDEVIQGEPVVTRHEIHALLGLAFLNLQPINLGAAEQPVGQGRHRTIIATEKAADIVAEPAIPFPPTVSDETAYLVQSGCIPGFRRSVSCPQAPGRTRCPKAPVVSASNSPTRRGRESTLQIESEAIHDASLPPNSEDYPQSSCGRWNCWS